MALLKVAQKKAPRRWALVAPSLGGKTTFAMQLATGEGNVLFLDPDHRAAASIDVAPNPDSVLVLDVTDYTNPIEVAAAMDQDVPNGNVRSIVVDSLTAIMDYKTSEAQLINASDHAPRNRSQTFLDKALTMRHLQDAVSKFGTDVLWIWHIESGKFEGNSTTRQTLSETERDRLCRNLNAVLEIIIDEKTGKRAVKVQNLRPKFGQDCETTLWDDTGCWRGIIKRIDAFLETVPANTASQGAGSAQPPTPKPLPFLSREQALAYAVEQKVYADLAAAEAAYKSLKDKHQPKDATAMFTLWNEHLIDSLRQRAAA